MNYKGYTIKEQTEPKFMGANYVFFKGVTYDGSPMKHADTLDEAATEIDELTCNDVDQVAALIKGLGHTLGAARAARDTLKNIGIQSDLLDTTISENEKLLKQLES